MVDRHSGIYQETNGTGALMSHRCLPPTLSKMNAITVQNKCRHRTALFDHKHRVPGRRRYSSYEGEVTPAPDNLVNRDFTAERPNEKWLTDITEIKASDGKVYLSPMIDCHDGMVVAHTAGTSVFWQVGVRSLGVVFSAGWAAGFPQDDQHSWGRPPSLFCSFVGYLVMRAC